MKRGLVIVGVVLGALTGVASVALRRPHAAATARPAATATTTATATAVDPMRLVPRAVVTRRSAPAPALETAPEVAPAVRELGGDAIAGPFLIAAAEMDLDPSTTAAVADIARAARNRMRAAGGDAGDAGAALFLSRPHLRALLGPDLAADLIERATRRWMITAALAPRR